MQLKDPPEIAYLLRGHGISGGVSIALSHVAELRKRGRSAAVFYQIPSADGPWHPLLERVPVYPVDRYYEICGDNGARHLVATWWMTAFEALKLRAGARHYFLQSLENRIYPEGDINRGLFFLSLFLNLHIFTEARWIQAWLRENLRIDAPLIPNGIDPEIFYPTGESERGRVRPRILIEGPADTPLKGVGDCFSAVSGLDAEVWYVCSRGEPDPAWRCDKLFRAVPFSGMREIYGDCDMLLKLSRVEGFFGPPLEMMACGGTCVVGDVTGHDEYCAHEKNCLVVPLGSPGAARQAIVRLLQDRSLLERLKQGALSTARQHAWGRNMDELSSTVFTNAKVSGGDPEMASGLIALKEHIEAGLMNSPPEGLTGKVRRKIGSLLRSGGGGC